MDLVVFKIIIKKSLFVFSSYKGFFVCIFAGMCHVKVTVLVKGFCRAGLVR